MSFLASKFYVLGRFVHDRSPGPWGPGWFPMVLEQRASYSHMEDAIRACRAKQAEMDERHWQFSVVVAEYGRNVADH
jgi:hypothetical protein